ncbi:hypothetical protein HDU67_004561, partial [Dinochytrium kinnereticum]
MLRGSPGPLTASILRKRKRSVSAMEAEVDRRVEGWMGGVEWLEESDVEEDGGVGGGCGLLGVEDVVEDGERGERQRGLVE